MVDQQTRHSRPVRIHCNICRTKAVLTPAHDVYIIRYKHAPWFDGFEWYCARCRTTKREFFDASEIQLDDIRHLGILYTEKFGDDRLARQYQNATGNYMPAPHNWRLEFQMAKFTLELALCRDISSIKQS